MLKEWLIEYSKFMIRMQVKILIIEKVKEFLGRFTKDLNLKKI